MVGALTFITLLFRALTVPETVRLELIPREPAIATFPDKASTVNLLTLTLKSPSTSILGVVETVAIPAEKVACKFLVKFIVCAVPTGLSKFERQYQFQRRQLPPVQNHQ